MEIKCKILEHDTKMGNRRLLLTHQVISLVAHTPIPSTLYTPDLTYQIGSLGIRLSDLNDTQNR